MEILIGMGAMCVLLAVWASVVNAKYEQKQSERGRSLDAMVRDAWESFEVNEIDGPARARFDEWIERVEIGRLSDKLALVQLAIMAIRFRRLDSLDEIRTRISSVAPSCGEGLSVAGLAEAYAGDPARARAILEDAMRTTAGCSSCGASIEAKILAEEVAIALHALQGEDANLGSSLPSS